MPLTLTAKLSHPRNGSFRHVSFWNLKVLVFCVQFLFFSFFIRNFPALKITWKKNPTHSLTHNVSGYKTSYHLDKQLPWEFVTQVWWSMVSGGAASLTRLIHCQGGRSRRGTRLPDTAVNSLCVTFFTHTSFSIWNDSSWRSLYQKSEYAFLNFLAVHVYSCKMDACTGIFLDTRQCGHSSVAGETPEGATATSQPRVNDTTCDLVCVWIPTYMTSCFTWSQEISTITQWQTWTLPFVGAVSIHLFGTGMVNIVFIFKNDFKILYLYPGSHKIRTK